MKVYHLLIKDDGDVETLLTVADAASYLNKSAPYIYSLLEEGKITAVKTDKTYVFKSSLEAYKDGNTK